MDFEGSLEIWLNSSKILFFISLAELFVKVRASIFLYESSSPDSNFMITLLAKENVLPEPALALII